MTTAETNKRPDAHWHSAHIYYYEPDKDALLLDAVRPLLQRLRPHVEKAYVVRHWRQGPHLRLNIRTDHATWNNIARPQIDQLSAYLHAHPSTAELDEQTEMPVHLLLAEREHEHGPLSPWYPDNTVHYQPYDARLHTLGNQQVADLHTEFLSASTEPLFKMLDHIREGRDSKELLCLALMWTVPHTLAPPLRRSFMSFRTHAEVWLAQTTDPPATRARLETYYQTHRDTLVNRAQAVITTLEGGSESPAPFVHEWGTLIDAAVNQATPAIEAGQVYQPTSAPQDNTPNFVNLLLNDQQYRARVLDTPRFHRYRLGLNWTYLQLNRLGITPPQRTRYCYLAAKAIEDLYEVSADEWLRNFIQERASTSNPRT